MALTPEQIQAYRQRYGIGQGASSVSASTDPTSRIKALREAAATTTQLGGVPLRATPTNGSIKDFGIGVAKGLGETAKFVLDSAAKATVPFQNTEGAPEKMAQLQDKIGLSAENLQAENTAQQTGKLAEIAAEIVTPAGLAKRAHTAANFFKNVVETVSPKLTPTATGEAVKKRGASLTGIFRKAVVNPDPVAQRIAEAVTQHVPNFNPSKTLVENINETRQAASQIADDLKQQVVTSGKDVIYPFKQLAAQLRNIERPTSLTRDLEPVYDRVQRKLLDIVRANGGRVSDLFQARKDFDAYVERALPRLYDKDYSPMRLAVTDMRRAVNDFIAEHLPKDIGFHDSLSVQHRLYAAIDNMAEKAASGADKEIGKGVIGRFLNKHPKLKRAGGYIATAIGGGAAGSAATGALRD